MSRRLIKVNRKCSFQKHFYEKLRDCKYGTHTYTRGRRGTKYPNHGFNLQSICQTAWNIANVRCIPVHRRPSQWPTAAIRCAARSARLPDCGRIGNFPMIASPCIRYDGIVSRSRSDRSILSLYCYFVLRYRDFLTYIFIEIAFLIKC